MNRWVRFFQFFQVVYLIAVIIAFLVLTGMILAEQFSQDEKQLYKEYILDRIEEFKENQIPPTESEIAGASYLFKALLFAFVPATLLIYRSRLLTLRAFVDIKKH